MPVEGTHLESLPMLDRVPELSFDKIEPVLDRMVEDAMTRGHDYLTLEHLLVSLLQDGEIASVLEECGGDLALIHDDLDEFLDEAENIPTNQQTPVATAALLRVQKRAYAQCYLSGETVVSPLHLLAAILPENRSAAAFILEKTGVDAQDVLHWLHHGEIRPDGGYEIVADAPGPVRVGTEAANEETVAPLAQFCVNLNQRAQEGKIDPVIGRDADLWRMFQVLAQRQENNAMLVGPSGVGKTAVVEGMARCIVDGTCGGEPIPAVFANAVVYSLDIGALVAGTRYRGEFEERLKGVLAELAKVAKAGEFPILFIDEFHTAIGAGAAGGSNMDATNLLKPALARGDLRCVGSTTDEEYRRYVAKDPALARRFQRLDITEPTLADAKRILRGLRSYYEEFHGIAITDEAVDAAVDLSARFLHDRKLPAAAIKAIDSAGALQRITEEAKRLATLTAAEIKAEIARMARIPVDNLDASDTERVLRLEDDLKAVVFGQDAAIASLTKAVKLSRAGLRDPEKPVGSYLFVGPTGVGKTEVCRQLARTLGIELQRFDMSEYQEAHTVARLIGSPPGYVGHGDGKAGSGLLSVALDQTPHCVLLLDEIEKAHPDLFNLFLQVMDAGRLTSGDGRTLDFRNVILVMTSNAGAADMEKAPIGFDREARTGEDDAAVQALFRPEFRNRLDAVVKFGKLQPEHMTRVVDKMIALTNALLSPKGITLTLTPDARDHLAVRGYDPQYGARPLARVIQDTVKQPLAEDILRGKLRDGDAVLVGVTTGTLTFTYTPPSKPPEVQE